MSKLVWAQSAQPFYEGGVRNGALYFSDGTVEAWQGLISVAEKPSDDVSDVYFEGLYVANTRSREDYASEVECFTYPPNVLKKRVSVFSYQTTHNLGFKLHLVYNPKFLLSAKSYSSHDDSAEVSAFSLELRSTPVKFDGYAPSSHVVIEPQSDDGTGALQVILDTLYGTSSKDPKMVSPDMLVAMSYDPTYTDIEIVDNGAGTLIFRGDPVTVHADGTFSVNHSRIRLIGTEEFASEIP